MATAIRIKSDPLPPPPDQIQLTLSITEARTLLEVVRRIGGNGETTARKYTDSIKDALYAAGISNRWINITENSFSSIYFTNDSLAHVERNG